MRRVRDLGRDLSLRLPGLARVVAPEGSRRRASLARLTGRKAAVVDPLLTPMSHQPEASEIRFAAPDTPTVSVVIPVYRNLQLTLRCLASLARAELAESFEVFVVDDSSGDGTAEALEQVAGVSVIRTPQNVGYLRATNTGIAVAHGEFVLLLNNDVEVHAGAVRALVDALRATPSAGAAGARLLYEDGVLQEAGSIIWSDGSGWSYGKREDARSPEFGHVRPVDYCSAACLLVRREPLVELGGFDDRYAPAYYEDSDLAFALRAKGLETIYVPSALVLHHEGASHGTSVRSGVKAYQERNRELFREKWTRELRAQRAPSVGTVVLARDRRNGPRLLVHGRTGAGCDVAATANDRGAVVTLVASDEAMADAEVETLRAAGVEVWPETSREFGRHIRALAPHLRAIVLADGGEAPAWVRRDLGTRVLVIDGRDPTAVEALLAS